ncbi:SDR family oxidoreductase [Hymenobacter fodinae]|uniref:SDR family oxidoreductase n=1 Tax=Hymenobacter fodinae TaxID=2510796 RepID=A0A4Z0NZP6_9BACT|nr:SDR family NAD(P)-dependent oxidoreductase [Hymenobacter fodinae]TGE03807.1 SDR family oxidoreductase [Hymenobacter fodinae]
MASPGLHVQHREGQVRLPPQAPGANGPTALVTGGTKSIADKLSQAGSQVIITARQHPGETELANQFMAADLTQPHQVDHLAQATHDTYGGVDIIIDNIGNGLGAGLGVLLVRTVPGLRKGVQLVISLTKNRFFT